MIRAGKQIAASALLLIVFCLVCRFAFFRSYTMVVPLTPAMEESFRHGGVRVEIEHPEIIRCGEPVLHEGYLEIDVYPVQPGDSDISFLSGEGERESFRVMRVSRLRTVFDRASRDFTGDLAVLLAITLFWLLVSAIMLWHFFQAKGAQFYHHLTVYYAGFSLFALVSGLVMLQTTVSHFSDPVGYSMMAAFSTLNSASKHFMMLTTPLMLAFAAAMSASNIALLRHERPRLQNILGLLVSLLLVAGEAVGWYLFTRDFSGSEWESRVRSTLENTYATVFVYFECMLAGAVICGIRAAKHEPAPDKDFIVILGCWFRKDGSLPPLLRGRVDRALAFWRRQKAETGKEAVFIPSGGQGRDEPMPEAEAMRRYLLTQDIPDSLIVPETKSASTWQNMANAREIIAERQPDAKTVFATTNYHVFRSGVWASEAGLPAEGIGSRTKWWFWPNAFMRETVGLLQKRWIQEILLLAALIAFFGFLSLVLG